MTLTEAVTLAVSHHPKPYRQLKWYYRRKIILAGMRGDILTTGDKYDRDSFMAWLKPKPVTVILDADVKLALDGKNVNEFVNDTLRKALKHDI